MTPTERIDKIIYRILTHGAKRRSEIIALSQNVAAEQTIDKHLSYLTEHGYIRKINSSGRGVYYQIQGIEENCPPQRRPNQQKLDRVLTNIEYRLQIRTDTRYPTMPVPTLSESMEKLYHLAKEHVFILETDTRYRRFKSIFDECVPRSVTDEKNVSHKDTVTSRPLVYFYLAMRELILNFNRGKDNEELFIFLHNELSWLQDNFEHIRTSLHLPIQQLALEADPRLGQELIIEIAYLDDLETGKLVNRILEAYERTNEINRAIDDLRASGNPIPNEDAENIITEIQNRYTETGRIE